MVQIVPINVNKDVSTVILVTQPIAMNVRKDIPSKPTANVWSVWAVVVVIVIRLMLPIASDVLKDSSWKTMNVWDVRKDVLHVPERTVESVTMDSRFIMMPTMISLCVRKNASFLAMNVRMMCVQAVFPCLT